MFILHTHQWKLLHSWLLLEGVKGWVRIFALRSCFGASSPWKVSQEHSRVLISVHSSAAQSVAFHSGFAVTIDHMAPARICLIWSVFVVLVCRGGGALTGENNEVYCYFLLMLLAVFFLNNLVLVYNSYLNFYTHRLSQRQFFSFFFLFFISRLKAHWIGLVQWITQNTDRPLSYTHLFVLGSFFRELLAHHWPPLGPLLQVGCRPNICV